jgi:hypothetical protein
MRILVGHVARAVVMTRRMAGPWPILLSGPLEAALAGADGVLTDFAPRLAEKLKAAAA